MKTTRRLLAATIVAGILLAALLSAPQAAAKGKPTPASAPYAVLDLGGFPEREHEQSGVERLSNPDGLGVVTIVGDSYTALGEEHAAVWTAHPDLGPLSLDDLTPNSRQGGALDTNDAGWVVGWSTEIGWLSIPRQPLIELPALSTAEGRVSWPTAINNANQIVGNGLVDVEVVIDGQTVIETEGHGLLWQVDETGTVVGLVDLGFFNPTDINDNGVMAGYTDDGAVIATVDSQGGVQITPLTAESSIALALNDVAQVVGWIYPAGGRQEAFLWDAENGVQLLGVLPDKTGSWAYGINNKGEIVGGSSGWPSKRNRPTGSGFLWRDGVMIDLNELHDTFRDFHVVRGVDINDKSQIAVRLKVFLQGDDSESHAGLLVPTQP